MSSLILIHLSINNPGVLTNPEKFLGPNYKDVLKFWMKLDELSKEQLRVVKERQCALYYENYSEWSKAIGEVNNASNKTIGREFTFDAAVSAQDVYCYAASFATKEIIGGVKNLVFLPMFDNL